MTVSKELLDSVKLYCKIDFDFEDDIIEEMIESAQEQICFAIDDGSTPEMFEGHAKFALAVKNRLRRNTITVVYLRIVIAIRLLTVF